MNDQKSKYTLITLVENRPGVLNRVASLFRRRGFNLDSLTVGRTERDELSRMTLVIDGTREEAIRAERELAKLIQKKTAEQAAEAPQAAPQQPSAKKGILH